MKGQLLCFRDPLDSTRKSRQEKAPTYTVWQLTQKMLKIEVYSVW